jgi:hypothetical protein
MLTSCKLMCWSMCAHKYIGFNVLPSIRETQLAKNINRYGYMKLINVSHIASVSAIDSPILTISPFTTHRERIKGFTSRPQIHVHRKPLNNLIVRIQNQSNITFKASYLTHFTTLQAKIFSIPNPASR